MWAWRNIHEYERRKNWILHVLREAKNEDWATEWDTFSTTKQGNKEIRTRTYQRFFRHWIARYVVNKKTEQGE